MGWAGGAAGPDFFIYMSPNVAVGWHNDHTVWGEVRSRDGLGGLGRGTGGEGGTAGGQDRIDFKCPYSNRSLKPSIG